MSWCLQVREDAPGPLVKWYRHISKGAWPFSTRDHGWPISDCSSEGLKVQPWCSGPTVTDLHLCERCSLQSVPCLCFCAFGVRMKAHAEKHACWKAFLYFILATRIAAACGEWCHWWRADGEALPVQAALALAELDPARVGAPIAAERLFDCVNVILSYQNGDGGWATYENTRSYSALEVRSLPQLRSACTAPRAITWVLRHTGRAHEES